MTNHSGEINECLSCAHADYDESEFCAARLTGKTFSFRCENEAQFEDFDESREHTTTERMSRWSNNCPHYELSTESLVL